ncbi:MAG: hypothetical protein NTW19_03940 [Planctomycetota bacterium]|nr:hypothetical protein [Planctomycetota bacterium]
MLRQHAQAIDARIISFGRGVAVMKLLWGCLFPILGAIAGTALGIGVAMGLAMYSKWQDPGDPSAGSVAIVGIFTVPFGFLLGAAVGGKLGLRCLNKPDPPDIWADSQRRV